MRLFGRFFLNYTASRAAWSIARSIYRRDQATKAAHALDEVDRGRGSGQDGAEHRVLIAVRAEADAQIGQPRDRVEGPAIAVNGRIQRCEQAYFVPGPVQVLGECRSHISQSAGLGKRRHFGCDGADPDRRRGSDGSRGIGHID